MSAKAAEKTGLEGSEVALADYIPWSLIHCLQPWDRLAYVSPFGSTYGRVAVISPDCISILNEFGQWDFTREQMLDGYLAMPGGVLALAERNAP